METIASHRISRELLSEKAADLLRRQILAGELPPGVRLVEDDLAAQMGTSRGPLRDAFAILAREGLVTTSHGKGTYVRGLTAAGVRQLYDVRTVLEAYGVGLAVARMDEEQAAELKALPDRMAQAVSRGVLKEYVDLDLAIHRRIWELSGNEYLANVLEQLFSPSHALITLNAQSFTDWPTVVDLHQRLVDAIVSGDAAGADRVLREHMVHSLNKALLALRS